MEQPFLSWKRTVITSVWTWPSLTSFFFSFMDGMWIEIVKRKAEPLTSMHFGTFVDYPETPGRDLATPVVAAARAIARPIARPLAPISISIPVSISFPIPISIPIVAVPIPFALAAVPLALAPL